MDNHFLKNLYVFEHNNGKLREYFIVEYDKIHDKYIEIFTGLKLSINNKNKLEPLSNYYSMIEIIGKLYNGDSNSLFTKYIYINYIKNLLDYEKEYNDDLDISIYNEIINNRHKSVGIKKYYINNLYLVDFENGFNYICVYNELNQNYNHVFTKQIVNQDRVGENIPLNKIINIDFDTFKVSTFTLLEIYNAINYINFYKKITDEEVIFELQSRGIYEDSKLYKKLRKK